MLVLLIYTINAIKHNVIHAHKTNDTILEEISQIQANLIYSNQMVCIIF